MDDAAKLAMFEETTLPHLNAAYNLAYWITRNQHDAEDVVQEAYLRAFRLFSGYRGGDGRAWVLAIVRNTCMTWLGRAKSRATVPLDEERRPNLTQVSNSETALLKQFERRDLIGCVEGLPIEFREVLILRVFDDMSYQQIAETVGVAIGTVMSRLSRARKRLADCVRLRVGRRTA
jgi:RNA polymerase sigma-70 factor (ECF subfamily)